MAFFLTMQGHNDHDDDEAPQTGRTTALTPSSLV
jgi:hypothetical protein